MKRWIHAMVALGLILGGAQTRAQDEDPAREEIGLVSDVADVLKSFSDHIRKLKSFSFHAEIAYDEVEIGDDDEGTEFKVQYGASMDFEVRHPDRIRCELLGDQVERRFLYDGKTMTMQGLKPGENYYAQMAAPPTIDAAMDKFFEKAGFLPPLVDLAYSDPYATLAPHLKDGAYIGLHKVRGVACHHLLLVQEAVNWQVWIEAGERPVPRKLVITYKELPGAPQYSAVLTDWKLDPALPDERFAFKAPKGALRVDMVASKLPASR